MSGARAERGPEPDEDPPTIELVTRAQGDPERAFGELYERIAPAVFAWASLHVREPLRSQLDPEDVLQEVSCRAFESFSRFDPDRGSVREWVFGIARNVLLGAMRRLGTGGALARLDTAGLAALSDPATTISRRVAREDGLRRFLARLESLDDEDRRLVVHRGLEGLPHDEVGAILGLEPKTAAKRWERLLVRLRGELGAPEIFVDER